MKVEIIPLSLFILIVGVFSQEDKCLLPDERKASGRSTTGTATAFTTFKSITANTKKPAFRSSGFKRQFDAIVGKLRFRRFRMITQAARAARYYCNPRTTTSTFKGFTIRNFKQEPLCPGEWNNETIQETYFDDKGFECWTFPEFTRLKCPTYNCKQGRCKDNLLRSIESKAKPRVSYRCLLSQFVDITYYTYCFHDKKRSKLKKETFTLARCCECTKLTCTK